MKKNILNFVGNITTKTLVSVETNAKNTDLKKRLTAYAERYPDHCIMTDEDSETGYKAFEIEKGRLSFRLTAPAVGSLTTKIMRQEYEREVNGKDSDDE